MKFPLKLSCYVLSAFLSLVLLLSTVLTSCSLISGSSTSGSAPGSNKANNKVEDAQVVVWTPINEKGLDKRADFFGFSVCPAPGTVAQEGKNEHYQYVSFTKSGQSFPYLTVMGMADMREEFPYQEFFDGIADGLGGRFEKFDISKPMYGSIDGQKYAKREWTGVTKDSGQKIDGTIYVTRGSNGTAYTFQVQYPEGKDKDTLGDKIVLSAKVN